MAYAPALDLITLFEVIWAETETPTIGCLFSAQIFLAACFLHAVAARNPSLALEPDIKF